MGFTAVLSTGQCRTGNIVLAMPGSPSSRSSEDSMKKKAKKTQQQMLALVQQRVPDFPEARKHAIAMAAVDVLSEPRHKDKPPMHAVKLAIARSYRHP